MTPVGPPPHPPPNTAVTNRADSGAGDSYTVGFGNVGGTTNCNATVCEIRRISGACYPELDSENAAISWGPLTAANFSADYQVLAWSGAGLTTYAQTVGETTSHVDNCIMQFIVANAC